SQLSRIMPGTTGPSYLGKLFNQAAAEPGRILHHGVNRRDKLALGLFVVADVLDNGQYTTLTGYGDDICVNQTVQQYVPPCAQLKALLAHTVGVLQQEFELAVLIGVGP